MKVASARWCGSLVLFGGAVCSAQWATAQSFPVRPVRWVVPYAPGGNTDMIARVIAQKLTQSLGQSVVVENRAGAATLIGAEFVARSAADGHTLLLATSTTLAINPHLYKTLPYDPVKDFAPVTLIARTPMTLVVHPSLPVRSVRDLVALARKRPGELAYGTAGTGSPSFMSMELFKSATRVDLIQVPYKGSGPADIDLLGGQIVMMFQNTSLAHVRAGRLRALAHTGEKRMTVAPEIPTLTEAGVPGSVFYSWQGAVVPARTPAAAIERLHEGIVAALRLPDVQARITADGAEIFAAPPDEFAQTIRTEIARFAGVIRTAGVRPE